MLKKIILEGKAGEIVGSEWLLDVESPNEAIRAIDAQSNGRLIAYLRTEVESGLGYSVTLSDEGLTSEKQYFEACSAPTIRFTPVIGGAAQSATAAKMERDKKSKNIIQVVIGVVLVIVGAVFKYPGLIATGMSMVLGGVAGLLTPSPKYKEAESERSTSLGGTVNTIRQGLPVPLGYGEMIVGSQMISVGVVNVDTLTPETDPGASQVDVDMYQQWLEEGNTGTFSAWYIISH